MSKAHLSCDYAAVLSTTDSTFLCAQGSRVKDVLHGHKGLTSNPGTLAFRNIKPYKTLMESCVVTDFCWKYLAFIGKSSSWWNVISSLFLARCTHGNEIAIQLTHALGSRESWNWCNLRSLSGCSSQLLLVAGLISVFFMKSPEINPNFRSKSYVAKEASPT